MTDEGEKQGRKEEKQIILGASLEEQQAKPISFSDSEVRIELPAPKESPPHSHRDNPDDYQKKLFSSLKFLANRRFLIYFALFLIIIFSIYVRSYTMSYPSLVSTDSFWQYRHANEIYEHGYPGTAIKQLAPEERSVCWREPACNFGRTKVYWDYLHSAPEGSAPSIELYPYFSAYSYKYFAKLFFPTLLDWIKVTPIFFAVLAALAIFLLAKEFFGEVAGVAASFFFAFSLPVIARSFAGYADSDMLIVFLFITTFYLFLRAWNKKSFKWAAVAGISFGLAGFAAPSSYTMIAIVLAGSTLVYFMYRILAGLLKKRKIFEVIREDWKGYSSLAVFLAVGLFLVALIESPHHANIFNSLLNFLQIKAPERTIAAAGSRNILLTVAEFQGISLRDLVYFAHVSLFVALAAFLIALFLEAKKKILPNLYYSIFLAVSFFGFLYVSMKALRFVEFFIIPAVILSGVAIRHLIENINTKKFYSSFVIIFFIIALLFFLPNINSQDNSGTYTNSYFQNTLDFGKNSLEFAQSDLPPPWHDFFTWVRENTDKGDVFASWWDHGHEFTALAGRPIVIDGSQSYSRVSDIANFFVAKNLSSALPLLKKYNVTYFFTSSDLYAKFASINYIATGVETRPNVFPLSKISQQSSNLTQYIYSLSSAKHNMIILSINKSSNEANADLTVSYNLAKIRHIYYSVDGKLYSKNFTAGGNYMVNETFYFTPDYNYAIPLPRDLDKTMLVNLQFLDAFGIEDNFKLVKSFGRGTVNLYKVIY